MSTKQRLDLQLIEPHAKDAHPQSAANDDVCNFVRPIVGMVAPAGWL